MIRELMIELHQKGKIYVSNNREANLIINRITYKIDPNNMPEIEELKEMIKKEV